MSKENEEARRLQCCEKYEKIAKQVKLLDEKTESMDACAKQEKRREGSSNGAAAASGSVTEIATDNQENLNHVIIEIPNFLDDLNGQATADNDPKTSNP